MVYGVCVEEGIREEIKIKKKKKAQKGTVERVELHMTDIKNGNCKLLFHTDTTALLKHLTTGLTKML